jgi:hypothetical protein
LKAYGPRAVSTLGAVRRAKDESQIVPLNVAHRYGPLCCLRSHPGELAGLGALVGSLLRARLAQEGLRQLDGAMGSDRGLVRRAHHYLFGLFGLSVRVRVGETLTGAASAARVTYRCLQAQ